MARHCLVLDHPFFELYSLVEQAILRQDAAEFMADEAILSPPTFPRISATVLPKSHKADIPPLSIPSIDVHPLPAPEPAGSKPSLSRKARRNAAAAKSRLQKRQHKRNLADAHYEGRPKKRKELCENSELVQCSFDPLKRQETAANRPDSDELAQHPEPYTLSEMVGEGSQWGFDLLEWDGSDPTMLVDRHNRLIGILAGHPDDADWPGLTEQAAAALEARRCHTHEEHRENTHRRGDFVSLRCGVSHGGGQTKPGNLQNRSQDAWVLGELNSLPVFRRLSGFASSVLATWAPGLHEHYKMNMTTLHTRYPNLIRIFPSGIFSAYSYNLGPSTVCSVHTDKGNLAYGMCSVTPFRKFDYKKGGHLILWDLCKVIEFPPGSTILFPSAIIAHSNVAIQKHETRYSFAQYTASGLFRWVDSGFQSRTRYLATLSPQELAEDKKMEKIRTSVGCSLLPTMSAST